MRRLIAVILSITLAFSLCGCFNRFKYSKEAITAAEDMIFYAEQYIDGKINVETAYKNIDSVYDKFDEYFETIDEDSECYDDLLFLSVDLLHLSSLFFYEKIDGGQISEIKEAVNKLKSEI